MSEVKAPRTYQEIQNQYTSLCNKAGHLNYQIDTHNRDLKLIYEELRTLNFEAAALQAKEQAAAAQAALNQAQAANAKAVVADVAPVNELPAVKKPRKLKEVKQNA